MDNICFSASKYYYVCIRVGVCGVCTTYVSDASFVSPVCLYAEYFFLIIKDHILSFKNGFENTLEMINFLF